MSKKIYGIRYKQGCNWYVSLVLDMKYIIENSHVLVYGEDEVYGYQRAPKRSHYSKIAKQLLIDIDRSVSPNSIILGINESDFESKLRICESINGEDQDLLVLEVVEENTILFRIIDGQHRVKGFEEAIKNCGNDNEKKKELEEYPVNVIIMLLDADHRLPEVYAFSDINSKAKPLKMDLTILSEYQYLVKEKPDDLNTVNFLATTVIKILIEGEKCKYWKNGIIIDINGSSRLGCVGFKSFLESILPICKKAIAKYGEENLPDDFVGKSKVLLDIANKISDDVASCWNVVFDKWPVYEEKWVKESDDNILTYYNNNYYLQRTMGTFAINKLICDSILKTGSISEFIDIINKCKLTINDWSSDGQFAGISSQSGVSKIKETILNG